MQARTTVSSRSAFSAACDPESEQPAPTAGGRPEPTGGIRTASAVGTPRSDVASNSAMPARSTSAAKVATAPCSSPSRRRPRSAASAGARPDPRDRCGAARDAAARRSRPRRVRSARSRRPSSARGCVSPAAQARGGLQPEPLAGLVRRDAEVRHHGGHPHVASVDERPAAHPAQRAARVPARERKAGRGELESEQRAASERSRASAPTSTAEPVTQRRSSPTAAAYRSSASITAMRAGPTDRRGSRCRRALVRSGPRPTPSRSAPTSPRRARAIVSAERTSAGASRSRPDTTPPIGEIRRARRRRSVALHLRSRGVRAPTRRADTSRR